MHESRPKFQHGDQMGVVVSFSQIYNISRILHTLIQASIVYGMVLLVYLKWHVHKIYEHDQKHTADLIMITVHLTPQTS